MNSTPTSPISQPRKAALIKATLVEWTKSTEDIIDNEVISREEANSATKDFKAVEDQLRSD